MKGIAKMIRPFRLHLSILTGLGVLWIIGGGSFFYEILKNNDGYLVGREVLSLIWLLALMVVFIMILQRHFETVLRDGQMHKLYFESSKSGILVFSEEGRLIEVNIAALNILGYEEEKSKLLNMEFDRIFKPYLGEKDHELGIIIKVLPSFLELSRRGDSSIDTSVVSGKGERVFLRVGTTVTKEPGDKGDIVIIVTIEDIYEKVKMDRSILSLNTILEKRVAERTEELRETIKELEDAKRRSKYDVEVSGDK